MKKSKVSFPIIIAIIMVVLLSLSVFAVNSNGIIGTIDHVDEQEQPLNLYTDHFIARIEDYPECENIQDLKEYIESNLSISELEIIDDSAVELRLSVGESTSKIHVFSLVSSGNLLKFSRHIGTGAIYDYYHVYAVYKCLYHDDCNNIVDTGEYVSNVCPGSSCQYN
ncbi:MAG: hypothetical protein WCQ72_00975 [Eubacteriales bacterium]